MNSPLKKNTSLEGFEQLWEAPEQSQSIDSVSNQIHAILKVLVDERIALNQEHQLVSELKQHVHSLEAQMQKLNWQLGQREQELSNLHSESYELKAKNESMEKQLNTHKELTLENIEIRRLAEQLSNQILLEKSKNEQLVELLMNLSNPELSKIMKKLGI